MPGLDPGIIRCSNSLGSAAGMVVQGGWVYIVTNRPYGTLYTGVTSDIARRAWKHRSAASDGFTARYDLRQLVLAERHETIAGAIQREKNVKHWPRRWKVALIERSNPNWEDLYELLARGT